MSISDQTSSQIAVIHLSDMLSANFELQGGPSGFNEKRNLFLAEGWTAAICHCDDCSRTLSDAGLAFLLVEANEEEEDSDDESEPQEDLFAKAELEFQQTTSIPHHVKLEMTKATANLVDRFKSFIKSKVVSENRSEITEEDVRNFFQAMESKRQKLKDRVPFD